MAVVEPTMAQMRLHGEDGKVYVTDTKGNNLWQVDARSISVVENSNAMPDVSITAFGRVCG